MQTTPEWKPCPECGGTRELFPQDSHAIRIPLGMLDTVELWLLICLDCGHTTHRPHPRDMARLRKAAPHFSEDQKY